jgi:hypothetical protein
MALHLDDVARVVELDDDIAFDASASQPDVDQSHSHSAPSRRFRAGTKINCPTCRIPLLKKALRRHNRIKHLDGDFGEGGCGKIFKQQDALKRHQREQHGNGIKTATCGICDTRLRPRAVKGHLQAGSAGKVRSPLAWS